MGREEEKDREEFRIIPGTSGRAYNIARQGSDVGADQPGVRLYCDAVYGGGRWALQVRGPASAKTFVIATAHLDRAALEWLRVQVETQLAVVPA